MGARVEVMSPEDHDHAAAIVSHLPHAIAGALLQTAQSAQTRGTVFRLAAGSFRDLTRVSDSSPELWRDICLTNVDSIVQTIEDFQARLDQFKEALSSGGEQAVEGFFEQARQIRQTYLRITK